MKGSLTEMSERGADALHESLMERFNNHHPREHRAEWEPRLLDEVRELVTSDRNRDYGDPWVNHGKTAELWRWWLKQKFGVDVALTDLDVCMFNILQKQSRLTNSPTHEDSWRDIIGFAANAGVCMDHKSGRIESPLPDSTEIE